MPHFRLPAISHGVASFLWAVGLGFYIWLGLAAIGVSQATAAVLAALSFGAIFLFVRIYGEEDLRRRPQPANPRDRAR